MTPIPWLEIDDPFPPVHLAHKDGLLAAGGDLSAVRLLDAYTRGIFPWYSEDQPILWWSPAPRCVLYPEQFHRSRSLKKQLSRKKLLQEKITITANRAFREVMHACATSGSRRGNTWITADMHAAYQQMHTLGWAHSIELWQNDILVGGLYGLAITRVFFGESMFSHTANASKIVMHYLCQALTALNFALLDCQVENPHLLSLGAQNISRETFHATLLQHTQPPTPLPHATLHNTLKALTA
jgi:leucyl/phenylalanyl-tRNA--protein transferase